MREILFKAIATGTGDWVTGQYAGDIPDSSEHCFIVQTLDDGKMVKIYAWRKTVCQYTGLRDRNGAMIFEGDILRFEPKTEWDKKNYSSFEVFYHDNDSADGHVGFQINRTRFWGSLCGGHVPDFIPRNTAEMTIIGNIHDK